MFTGSHCSPETLPPFLHFVSPVGPQETGLIYRFIPTGFNMLAELIHGTSRTSLVGVYTGTLFGSMY